MTICPNCQKKTKPHVEHVGGRYRQTLAGEQRFQTIWHLKCEKCHQPYTDSYPPEEQLVPLPSIEEEVEAL